jgi:hypothetical protein
MSLQFRAEAFDTFNQLLNSLLLFPDLYPLVSGGIEVISRAEVRIQTLSPSRSIRDRDVGKHVAMVFQRRNFASNADARASSSGAICC